jgi:DNA-binding Xre family transcriptional regulator
MPMQWTLRKWLAVTHDLYGATALRKRILDTTGVDISSQALGELLRKPPRALRVDTVQAICTALQCKLSDFCEVIPSQPRRRARHRPYASQGRKRRVDALAEFPAPPAVDPPKKQR